MATVAEALPLAVRLYAERSPDGPNPLGRAFGASAARMVSVWRSAKHVAMPGFAVWAQTRAVGWTAAAVADCAVAGSAGAVKARAAKPAMARTLRGERRMDHSPGENLRMVGPHGCAVYTAPGLLLKSVTDSAPFVP